MLLASRKVEIETPMAKLITINTMSLLALRAMHRASSGDTETKNLFVLTGLNASLPLDIWGISKSFRSNKS